MSERQLHAVTALVLGVIVFSVFSGVLQADFVQWDDDINIYLNPHIQGLDWGRLVWMFTDREQVRYYAPLSWLTLALIHSVFGLKPFGYHLTNLLLHCANTILLFFLIKRSLVIWAGGRALENKHQQEEWRLTGASAIGALFWALHPLRVEPVAWATGLSNCLALFFCLVAVSCFLKAEGEWRSPWFWVSVASYAISLLCYPIGLGLPVAFFLLALYLPTKVATVEKEASHNSPLRMKLALLRVLPYATPALGVLALTLYRRLDAVGIWSAPLELEQFSLEARVFQAFYIWAYYLWKAWLPLNLSPVYTTLVWFEPTDWPFLLSAGLILTATMFFAYQRHVWPGVWLLWLCYLGLLIPLQGWFEHPHYPSDRYSLMAHVPLAVAVGYALRRANVQPALGFTFLAGVTAIVVWLAGISVRQVRVWRDSGTLFNHVLSQLGPSSYRADILYRLGTWKQAQGATGEARRHYAEALEIHPYFADAHARLAVALVQEGRVEEAVQHYAAALKSNPDQISALNNLAWLRATHPKEALRDGLEAVRLAERACELTGYGKPMLMGTLAAAYAEAGRYEDAVAMATRAAALAREQGETELAQRNEALREVYTGRSPYRETR